MPDFPDLSRRGFLRTSSAVGAGAVIATTVGGMTASPPAAAAWRYDTTAQRFTVAVMPDTQYLFDGDSIHPEPLAASFRYLYDRQRDLNLAFLAHLGDVTQNGAQNEITAASRVFDSLDRAGASWSVLAGNHDVNPRTDDQRGPTPFLKAFGPSRFRRSSTYRGASPDGYNSYHVFSAAGRDWLVLSLDWRLSAAGFAWARGVLTANRTTPTILISHELVAPSDDTSGKAEFSEYGNTIWTSLVNGFDQVFLTLNGHFWPSARMTARNDAGHDVHLHITNYQNRYYGGAAMIRLYHFDLNRKVIDVETVNPFIEAQDPRRRNELAAQEVELSGDVDRFSIDLDPDTRFAAFAPPPVRPPRAAAAVLIRDTAAYWRFDGNPDGSAVAGSTRVKDLSGKGNDLVVATTAGSAGTDLTWSSSHHPDQPAAASLLFNGKPKTSTYLQTVDGAPINTATFASGYTVEAFFRLTRDFDADANGFSAVLSRYGNASAAGKAGGGASGDPDEPVVTLSLSGDRELQWCVYPTSSNSSITNWGHELPLDRWWHVAVVNDTRRTVMYVDGCEVVRNPSTPNRGLATVGKPWLVGGYEYGNAIDKTFVGWIGDIRVVARALNPREFMIS
ncbi:LamG-like jellyroll fold domain-containing protein [Williamsia sp. CHRR-6]|uniref:LamG-like jellyroll fold domain-containing protein n=1 Tax=Williamsia sp. CHRR-6 TaxID=2835871 RepID=UPI001BD9EC50|nr:LamG-like jellyroll fold domain-containing protein [Williamsia sp. CHRR-6]MBT0567655.1 metallophosphoesterase [Williamsia sp. CHRR-6]